MAARRFTILTKQKMDNIWRCISLVKSLINISGAIEPRFYAELVKRLELDDIPDREYSTNWGVIRDLFTEKFLQKSQSEWEKVFNGTDSCVTPVIPLTPEGNRPLAQLSESPGLDVSNINLEMLKPGTGTKDIMREWVGWTVGKEYTVDMEGTVNIAGSARL